MTEWDPNQFVYEQPVGNLVGEIQSNRRVDFPDGTHITKEETGYAVRNRHGRQMGFHDGLSKESARSAAQHALDSSAQSRNKKSLGGGKRYAGLKQVRDKRPLEDPGIII
jgi:hypothetical protein